MTLTNKQLADAVQHSLDHPKHDLHLNLPVFLAESGERQQWLEASEPWPIAVAELLEYDDPDELFFINIEYDQMRHYVDYIALGVERKRLILVRYRQD